MGKGPAVFSSALGSPHACRAIVRDAGGAWLRLQRRSQPGWPFLGLAFESVQNAKPEKRSSLRSTLQARGPQYWDPARTDRSVATSAKGRTAAGGSESAGATMMCADGIDHRGCLPARVSLRPVDLAPGAGWDRHAHDSSDEGTGNDKDNFVRAGKDASLVARVHGSAGSQTNTGPNGQPNQSVAATMARWLQLESLQLGFGEPLADCRKPLTSVAAPRTRAAIRTRGFMRSAYESRHQLDTPDTPLLARQRQTRHACA